MTARKLTDDLVKRPWSAAEDEILRARYATTTREALQNALPGRSINSIGRRAHELGLRREKNPGRTGKVVSPIFVREGVEGKACTRCLEWQPLTRFAKHKTCAGGRRNACHTCAGRQAYTNNPKRCIAQARRWQTAHPVKAKLIRKAADARRRGWMGGDKIEPEALTALFEQHGWKCAYCATAPAESIDHVVPLSRGGAHAIENILPACLDCNRRKHARTPEQWRS